MSTVNFNVGGDPRNDQPRIVADNPPGGTLLSSHFEGLAGQTPNRWVATVPSTITGAATVFYQQDTKSFRVILPSGDGPHEASSPECLPPEYHGDASKVALVYTPVVLTLRRDGLQIRRSDGSRYIHLQATNYLAFQRYLEQGWDAVPFYPGFNGYNVTFSMRTVPAQAGLRPLRPEQYGNFFPMADAFLRGMQERGYRLEATLLCDCQDVDLPWQRSFVGQMEEILRQYAHMEQLANEPPNNNVDPRNFTKPAGIFACAGSSLSGEPCPLPAWDYSTAHLGRGGPGGQLDAQPLFMEKGYPGYPGTWGSVIVNESKGATDGLETSSRTPDPWYFYQIGCAMRGYSGGTFHFNQGIHSDPLTPGTNQDLCRQAFIAGVTGQSWG